MTAIVLLPGMDGTGDLFTEFAAALGDDVLPITVCYPKEQALDYSALVEFVRPQLPTDRPFVLLGESFSGPVAVSLAALKPAGLMGLILCCSFVRNPIPLLRPIKMLTAVMPIHSALVGCIAPFLFGEFSSPHLRAALHRALDRVPAATLRARLRSVLDVDFSDKLQEISVPTLYLQAMGDRVVPPSAAQYIETLMPAVQIVSLEAPHLLLQTLPVQAATIVRKFLHETAMTFNAWGNKDALPRA
jgi:pimeloyl-[acyl-carrier protein] methyl ester esterase